MRRLLRMHAAILTGILLASLTGCDRGNDAAAPSPSTQTTSTTQPTAEELASLHQAVRQSAPTNPLDLPPGHPGMGDMAPRSASTGTPNPHAAETPLKYQAPDGWQKEPVSGSMRKDQYRLPHTDGDTEDGELAVFAGIGGTVADNVARWRGQFTNPDGQPLSQDAFSEETIDVNGLKVTVVDVHGRFSSGMMMGGSATPKDNWRMLGAIVETPNGLWYFKATGPAATMEKQKAGFTSLVHSLSLN
jgi:hypothetical protein